MKKLLALVLALVMTMSLAVSANAFTDDKDIDANYDESIAVLAGMKVFVGDDKGNFNPKKDINRAEAAALVYRLYTADVKDAQAGFYASYSNFTDLTYYEWAEGYIGYCQNAGLIKGYGDGKFGPGDGVTGYQVLAMILRAVGYGQNGEFTGADWATNVAKLAQQLGILDTVKTVDLSKPATREVVAELLFQAITSVPMVTYTPAFGYQAISLGANQGNLNVKANATLAQKNFYLEKSAIKDSKWGRPSYNWYNEKTGAIYYTKNIDALKTYTTAQTECNIATDLGYEANKTLTKWDNGLEIKSGATIRPLATKATFGAQGQLVEFYSDRVVVIDTYLAKVTNVVDAKYDKAGHLKSESYITFVLYNEKTENDDNGRVITLYNGEDNYTYSKGDMILVNLNNTEADSDILGLATSIDGYQTVHWFYGEKHTVNGTDYNDAYKFFLDQADENTKNNYTWYFDQYGNLIGDVVINTVYDYAVLKNIVWNHNGLKGGYATGTLVYMDGSENEVTIAKIDDLKTVYYDRDSFGAGDNCFYVTSDPDTNARIDDGNWIEGHLLSVDTDSNGYVYLNKVGEEKVNGTHTEIAEVNVYTKDAKIGTIKVDNATKFLVLTAAGYKTYEGIKNVPTMLGCTVDYVMGTNNVAKYVYIINGTDVTVNSANLVLVTTLTHNKTLANGIYTLNINANDAENKATIQVAEENYVEVIAKLISKDAVNQLFYITYEDGLAVSAEAVKGGTIIDFADGKTHARELSVDALTYLNGFLNWNGYTWYVDEDTTVIGEELVDNMDFSETRVYVVYTYELDANDNAYARVASTVYIVDIAE